MLGNDCIRFPCIIINHISQKAKHALFREDQLFRSMVRPDDFRRIRIIFKNGNLMFLYHGKLSAPCKLQIIV